MTPSDLGPARRRFAARALETLGAAGVELHDEEPLVAASRPVAEIAYLAQVILDEADVPC